MTGVQTCALPILTGALAYSGVSNTTLNGSANNIINKSYADAYYLTITNASATYQPISQMPNYTLKAGDTLTGPLVYSGVTNGTIAGSVNNLINKSYADSNYCLQSTLGSASGIAQLDTNSKLTASQVPCVSTKVSLGLYTCPDWTLATPVFTQRYASNNALFASTGSTCSAYHVVSGTRCSILFEINFVASSSWSALPSNDFVLFAPDSLTSLPLPKAIISNSTSDIILTHGFSEGQLNTTNGTLPNPLFAIVMKRSSAGTNGGIYLVLKGATTPVTGLTCKDSGNLRCSLSLTYETI